MDRVAPNPRDENIIVSEGLCGLPEHHITVVTSQEVAAAFVIFGLVYFDAENVPVVKNHYRPTVHSLKTARPVLPWLPNYFAEEIIFKHSEAPGTHRPCTADLRYG